MTLRIEPPSPSEHWHEEYAADTMDELSKPNEVYKGKLPPICYQGALLHDGLFTIPDFLLMDDDDKYDIIEVKTKTSVRKNGPDSKLKSDILYDASFQHYVATRALGDRYSGHIKMAFPDKTYVRGGEETIDPDDLVKFDDVTDALMSDAEIEEFIGQIRAHIRLPEDEFERHYPFSGSRYKEYFGKNPDPGAIWAISGANKRMLDLEQQGMHRIEDVTPQAIKGLTKKQAEYVQLWQQGETIIDRAAIRERLDRLKYPLIFYDYETVTSPIPIFEDSYPNQQVVVQYAMQIIQEDGRVESYGKVWERLEHYRAVVGDMISHLEPFEGTCIVWNKAFENTRNTEMAKLFPDIADILETINTNTFDLMDIFKDRLYFDRRFGGSYSIKKVLPVLTDLSYEDLEVRDGGTASAILREYIDRDNLDRSDEEVIEVLKAYCGRDVEAMVGVWRVLKRTILKES